MSAIVPPLIRTVRRMDTKGRIGLASATVCAHAGIDSAGVQMPPRKKNGTRFPAINCAFVIGVTSSCSSVPTDRDGNSPRGISAATYRLLAHALAERGIATLRVDKRGIGESAEAYAVTDLFGGVVTDAEAWLAHLRLDPRFSSVSVAGHSGGALIGGVAGADGRADALVSVSGAGEPAGAILRRQLSERLPEAMRPDALAMLDSLDAGRLIAEPPGMLAQIFPPVVQPYMISWMAHDPAEAVAAFGGPVLAVQGTTDVQTSVADAERLAAADPAARLLLIDGMNHVLKDDAGDAAAQVAGSHADPSLPLSAELVRETAAFLLGAR